MPVFPLWFLLLLVVLSFICGKLFERDASGVGSGNLLRAAVICLALIESLDEIITDSKDGMRIYREAIIRTASRSIKVDRVDNNSIIITSFDKG